MNAPKRTGSIALSTEIVSLWINRSLETLWLLMIVMVPLIFSDREYLISEAVISYVEIPKVALLRFLASLMMALCLVKWAALGGLPLGLYIPARPHQLTNPSRYLHTLRRWLGQSPPRLLGIAAVFFFFTTFLSTVLSGSFKTSLWGEVPGQDSYSAYTVFAYILAFAVIATHLKTRPQLWRLLAALVSMGTIVAVYAIFQHYGNDFFSLSEPLGGKVSSFMGNRIFAAAIMTMTIPISVLPSLVTTQVRNSISPSLQENWKSILTSTSITAGWGLILGIQLLGLTLTLSRGPWLGTGIAIAIFAGLAFLFLGRNYFVQALLTIGLAATFAFAILQAAGSVTILNQGAWLAPVVVVIAMAGVAILKSVQRHVYRILLSVAVISAVLAILFIGRTLLQDNATSVVAPVSQIGSVQPSTGNEISERLGSVLSPVQDGFTGGRVTHWDVSWDLIQDRPWFEFESLSLSWLRPLIGYGPDLYRYTYLLKSPAEPGASPPLEPDHAHNFFIHQAVEQGLLGILSSTGLFIAIFVTGGYLLVRRKKYSDIHKLVIIALVATIAGRFAEMMVGVARVSDLTVLWIVLAVFMALPAVFEARSKQVEPIISNQPNYGESKPPRSPNLAWHTNLQLYMRITIVVCLLTGIGVLIWVKNINYVRASVSGADGLSHARNGDFQSSLDYFDRAITLAPDVAYYHMNRSQVFLAYQLMGGTVAAERGCENQGEMPYQLCLGVEAFQSSLNAVEHSPYSFRAYALAGNSAYNLDLHEEAIYFYRNSASLVPASWQQKNELADAYIVGNQPSNALPVLQKSLALTEGTEHSTDAMYLQGIAYLTLKNLKESIYWLEESLASGLSGQKAEEAHQNIVTLYKSQGQEIGLEVYNRAISRNPRDAVSYYHRALAHVERGEDHAAVSDFDAAIKLTSNNWKYYAGRAEAHVRIGEREAVHDFTEAIKLNPRIADLHIGRGLSYHLQLNLLDEAIMDFNLALLLEPERSDIYRYRASVYFDKKLYLLALDDLNRAADLYAFDTDTYQLRAETYSALGDHEIAIEDLNQAIKLDPAEGLSYLQRAQVYQQSGEMDQSIESYYSAYIHGGLSNATRNDLENLVLYATLAITKDSKNPAAFSLRGGLFNESGEYYKAIDDWDKAAELRPGAVDTYIGRARAYAGLGLIEQLETDLNTIETLDPDNHDILSLKAYILTESGDFDKAVSALNNIIVRNPKDAENYRLRGNLYRDRGQLNRSIVDYGLALRIDPENSITFVDRGIAYNKMEKFSLAKQDFSQAIRLDSSTISAYENRKLANLGLNLTEDAAKDSYQAKILLAQKQSEIDKLEEAFQTVAEAITLNPNNPEGFIQRSLLYERANDMGSAIDDLNEASKLAPDDRRIYTQRGIMQSKQGNYELAIHDFDIGHMLGQKTGYGDPKFAQNLLYRAEAHFKLANYVQAIEDSETALGFNLDLYKAQVVSADAHVQLGKLSRAENLYSRAIAIRSLDAELYLKRAITYGMLGENKSALADLEQAIELGLTSGLLFAQRGLAHNKLENHPDAILDFDQAINLGYTNAEVYLHRGISFTEVTEYGRAIQDLNQAISLNNDLIRAYHVRGLSHLLNGNLDLALQDSDKLATIDPRTPESYDLRGRVYNEMGLFEWALKDFNHARSINPGHEYGDPAFAPPRFYRAVSHFNLGNINEAIDDLNLALSLDPRFVEAFILRGKLRIDQEQFHLAVLDLNEAVKLDPLNSEALSELSRAEAKLGDT